MGNHARAACFDHEPGRLPCPHLSFWTCAWGARFPLSETPIVIGRGSDCDIRINDHSVSRRHARLQPGAEGHYAVDLQSTNGTFVNDVPGLHVRNSRTGDPYCYASAIAFIVSWRAATSRPNTTKKSIA